MSVFNPSQFLSTTFPGGEKLDTVRIPPPEGEYHASVIKVAGRAWKNEETNQEQPYMDVSWELEDLEGKIKAITGRDKNVVVQGIALDLTPEGNIDRSKGQNVGLGRLLEAVGLNGKKWSPTGLQGMRARVLVTHRSTDQGPMAQIRKVLSNSAA
jgi:hypothetical protein